MKILDLAFGGNGVAKLPDGRVVFVPYTIPGEEIKIKNIKNKSSYSTAELDSVITVSPYRIKPICPHYMQCGGCQYMHIDYKKEVEYKQKQLKDTLIRIGKIENPPDIEVFMSDQEYNYRNSISLQKGIGFFSTDNQEIVPIEKCFLVHEKINEFLKENKEDLFCDKKVTIKTDGTQISFIEDNKILEQTICGKKLCFDHKTFFQVNTSVLEKIIETLKKETEKSETLFDLYCGVGTYSICLQENFSKILGVEENHKSIEFARQKSDSSINFFTGKVEDMFQDLYNLHKTNNNTIILNPPRIGMQKSLIDSLEKADDISKIIYVSCNPATLARDIKQIVQEKKFAIEKIYLFDIFPRTKYFETVIVLG